MNGYDNLRTGAPNRLKGYRRKHAASLATVAKNHGPDSAYHANVKAEGWRGERWITPHGLGFNADYSVTSTEGGINADTGYLDHLREVSLPEAHRWFTDIYCSEWITVKVWRLPRGRFIASLHWSDCDGITILPRAFELISDAYNAAGRLAKKVASAEQDYNEKWNEARDADEAADKARDRIADARETAVTVIDSMREARTCLPPNGSVMTLLREALAEARKRMREAIGECNAHRAIVRKHEADGVQV